MGTNWLIKEKWAEMLTDVTEITNKKTVVVQEQLFDDNLPTIQKKIIDLLKYEALSVDEICHKTGMNVTEVNLTVTMMGLNNLVSDINGKVCLN